MIRQPEWESDRRRKPSCADATPCPGRPHRRLRRFRDRPWLCPTCHTWWITRREVQYEDWFNGDQYGWRWVPLDTAPVPKDAYNPEVGWRK